MDEDKKPLEQSRNLAECMGKHRHHWQWVWEGPHWTNNQRCTTCGEVRVRQKPTEGGVGHG